VVLVDWGQLAQPAVVVEAVEQPEHGAQFARRITTTKERMAVAAALKVAVVLAMAERMAQSALSGPAQPVASHQLALEIFN
jgi:hypothetical protein